MVKKTGGNKTKKTGGSAPPVNNAQGRGGYSVLSGINDWEKGKHLVFTPAKDDHVNTPGTTTYYKGIDPRTPYKLLETSPYLEPELHSVRGPISQALEGETYASNGLQPKQLKVGGGKKYILRKKKKTMRKSPKKVKKTVKKKGKKGKKGKNN
jgi:hypothetical protein